MGVVEGRLEAWIEGGRVRALFHHPPQQSASASVSVAPGDPVVGRRV